MEGDIGIDMGCDNGLLKIVITDNGIPFNPLETREPDITLPLEERPIGGLGIFLVKTTDDRCQIRAFRRKE